MVSEKKKSEPILSFERPADWYAWLASNHEGSHGVMLRIDKTRAAKSITYAQAIDVALAWGWIDSQKRTLDVSAWLQRFSKRTAKSPWSKINREKAEGLIAAGAM